MRNKSFKQIVQLVGSARKGRARVLAEAFPGFMY